MLFAFIFLACIHSLDFFLGFLTAIAPVCSIRFLSYPAHPRPPLAGLYQYLCHHPLYKTIHPLLSKESFGFPRRRRIELRAADSLFPFSSQNGWGRGRIHSLSSVGSIQPPEEGRPSQLDIFAEPRLVTAGDGRPRGPHAAILSAPRLRVLVHTKKHAAPHQANILRLAHHS